MTALTSVGAIPDLTLNGPMRPRGIYIAWCKMQD
jgi:hypothetical protein